MNKKMLNIFVCGKFHYHKYVAKLQQLGVLNKIYFSHKLGQTLELEKEAFKNFFIKEYLLNAHLHILGDVGLSHMMPIYHRIWYKQVLRSLDIAEYNLFLAHGNCLEIMEECKRRGGKVIAEVVNAHPEELNELLQQEHQRLRLPFKIRRSIDERIVEEVNLADIVLAPSKVVAQSYIRRGVRGDKVKILNYGSFPLEGKTLSSKKIIHKYQDSLKEFKILCVAKITPRKGQIYLLRAVQLLRENFGGDIKIKLTLVGRRDTDYFKIISELGIEFTHIQHIDNSQMYHFMMQYNLFVLPSIEDGFAVVVGEALSAGLPVITTLSTGAADVVEQINPALVVPAGDYEIIANAIIKVMRNEIEFKSVFVQGWSEYALQLYEKIIVPAFKQQS
jgi:glycosyltransferase involved in cell wall biosynthesis